MSNFINWLLSQEDEEFQKLVGKDLASFAAEELTIEELEELDNEYIFNDSPEGGE